MTNTYVLNGSVITLVKIRLSYSAFSRTQEFFSI